MNHSSPPFSLASKSVEQDPDIKAAKEQIIQTIEKHKRNLTQVRPPHPGLEKTYAESVKSFGNLRGIPLWHSYIGSGMGNGALVELEDGSVKYDFISGIGAHWGHCHPLIISASLDAACQDIVMQGNLQQNADSFALCNLLTQTSGFEHCLLTSSGAMAMENALKIVFQKKYPATRILAFERCFAGRTLSLAQITDKPSFREGLPSTLFVDYVPFYDWKDPAESTERAVHQLKKHLLRYPKQHAGMCFEMVQGEAGYYPGSHEFFMSLITILKENGVPVLVDEIQTFGRSDSLYAFQHFDLAAHVDVVTVGKLLQVCATLYRDSFKPKPGLISQTFTGATSSIRVGSAIIHSLQNDDYLGTSGKNMRIRKHFVDHLQRLTTNYPHLIEGPFGFGLMIAFTLFKGDAEKTTSFAQELFKAGVIGFIAGTKPIRFRFLVPAGGVTLEDIDNVAKILEETLIRFK